MRGFQVLLVIVALSLGAAGCSEQTCPGVVCTDCAPGGNCDIQCPDGLARYCGHFGYFDDPDLRCAWCGYP